MGAEFSANPSLEAQKEVMITDLASKLHDMWREPRRLDTPTSEGLDFEPRIKQVDGMEFDIANLNFTELPEKFQAENRAAAEGAINEIPMLIRQFGKERLDSPEAIESLSIDIHKQWMERNGAWAPAEQMVDYSQLPETEKEKDRVIARAAIATYQKESA